MNLFRFRQFLALGACGLLATLGGCDKTTTAGGSDEIDTRLAVDRTGHPVAGARISLLKAGDSTGKVVAVNATADDGSYPEFRVPDGFYSVLVRDDADSLGKFVDSLQIESHKVPKGRDTLLSLGSVRGVVRVAQGHTPATVTVGLLGTDIVANVKSDGTFKIELVPGSLYTLVAIPSLEGYGPLYKRIQLKDGQDLTLPDTLVMPVTGLPVPGGLSVSEESLTGNVRLVWNRVDHPDLLGYVLDRVEGGVVTSSRYLTDTTWTDSFSGYWEQLPLLGPWPSREVAYRVRSRSLGGLPDSRNAASTFTVKPPRWTRFVNIPEPKLSQDSMSGNVQLSWSVVRHPRLSGYVVERIVGGVVVASSILRDTSYLDLLGLHWDTLPLSGPWPDLDVHYRIAAIAKDTAGGAISSIQCHPPKWVKSVDSTRISVTQDSLTGNVRVAWTPVKHPHLVGYAVDRIENGIVRSGPNVVDTNFVDTLAGYWTGLRLLGPWPNRRLSYRVRLIADQVGTDGVSDTVAFDALPPTWTRRVDSVKVAATTDSATGVTTLTWNALLHPDVKGWEVVRTKGGLQDCSGPASQTTWNDKFCTERRFETYDTITASTISTERLLRERGGNVEYQIRALRGNQGAELVSTVPLLKRKFLELVEWRDSGVVTVPSGGFKSIGGWMIQQTSTRHQSLSQDGANWEPFPEELQDSSWRFVGLKDSAWLIRLNPDSVHIELARRAGPGVWSKQSIASPIPVYGLRAPRYSEGSITYFGLLTGIQHDDCFRFRIQPEEIRADSSPREGYVESEGEIRWTYSWKGGYTVYSYCRSYDQDLIIEQQAGGAVLVIGGATSSWNGYMSVDKMSEDRLSIKWNSGALNYFIGAVGEQRDFVYAYQRDNVEHLAYFGNGSDSWILPDPPGSGAWVSNSSLVFHDEIWAFRDGHLWKGKLNLPK